MSRKSRKSIGDVLFGMTHLNFDENLQETKPGEELSAISHKLLSYLETKQGSFKLSKVPKADVLLVAKEVVAQVLFGNAILANMGKSLYIRKWVKGGISYPNEFPFVPVVLVFQSLPKENFKSCPKMDGDFNLSKAHPCVCIGPWKFCYNTVGLVIPKVQSGLSKAIFTLHVGTVKIDNLFANKVSELTVKWNATKHYGPNSNSWIFCMELLDTIGIQFNPSTYQDPIRKSIFVKIDKYGPDKTAKSYNLPNGVLKNEKTRKIQFKTHVEFDDLVNKVFADCKDFKISYPYDYLYLKGIDEAFWCKHYHAIERIEDLDENFAVSSKCPFGDPRDRGCFIHCSKTLTEKKFSVNL